MLGGQALPWIWQVAETVKTSIFVFPAKAGTQAAFVYGFLGPRFRGDDNLSFPRSLSSRA
jgi:hypothetical protein